MDLHDTDLHVTRGLRGRLRAQRGQVAVETVGMFGLIGLIALLLWQIALVGYTYVLAGHAAREGARALAVDDEVRPVVREDLPKRWRDGMKLNEGDHDVRVRLAVPIVVPGVDGPLRVSSTAETSVEDEPVPESQQAAETETETKP
jgi:pilus assembly protein CpaE